MVGLVYGKCLKIDQIWCSPSGILENVNKVILWRREPPSGGPCSAKIPQFNEMSQTMVWVSSESQADHCGVLAGEPVCGEFRSIAVIN